MKKYSVNISINSNFQGDILANSEEEARDKIEQKILEYLDDIRRFGVDCLYTETPHYEVKENK